jgi:branched-subunit amino acid transport protein
VTVHWIVILVVAAATYLTRVSGLLIAGRRVPKAVDRFLAFIPVTVFASLVTPDAGVGTASMWPRLAGLLVAAGVSYRYRQLWPGLLAGMAVFEALRLV